MRPQRIDALLIYSYRLNEAKVEIVVDAFKVDGIFIEMAKTSYLSLAFPSAEAMQISRRFVLSLDTQQKMKESIREVKHITLH